MEHDYFHQLCYGVCKLYYDVKERNEQTDYSSHCRENIPAGAFAPCRDITKLFSQGRVRSAYAKIDLVGILPHLYIIYSVIPPERSLSVFIRFQRKFRSPFTMNQLI